MARLGSSGERSRRRLAATVPYGLIAVILVADIAIGSTAILLPLFAVPPALAAANSPPRAVRLIGGVALVACVAAATAQNLLDTRRGAVACASVVGSTLAAWYASAVRTRAEERLGHVQAVADVAQRSILGPVPRDEGPLHLAASYTSAFAEARIGGDLYAALPIPGGLRLIVGDVEGRGLEAVNSAVVVLRAFREAAPEADSLQAVGESIERSLARRPRSDEFVTAVLAECAHDGHVVLHNFGHPAPLLRRADGTARFAEPDRPGLPLGMAALNHDGPGKSTVHLEPDDGLLFYTDGTVEARNADGDFFPLLEHADLLDRADPDEALAVLRRTLIAHTASGLDDDAALLLLRRSRTSTADAAA
ncbi:serine/threonine-protein phosphatase [Streptomycetaceae bacterium NBC_01309]